MSELFIEAIVAPEFSPEALAQLSRKKALRLVQAPVHDLGTEAELDMRSVEGGMLIQSQDGGREDPASWTCVTQRQPGSRESRALELNWQVVRHVKSNAIVIGNSHQTVGIGAGQMSRVDAVTLARWKAGKTRKGVCLASDAFFPKPDAIAEAARAGVVGIIQPGGSIADEQIIHACDRHKISMVFTAIRHFKH